MNKVKQYQDFALDREYELPECAFKFVYQEAIDPDYAERLIDDLNSIKHKEKTK